MILDFHAHKMRRKASIHEKTVGYGGESECMNYFCSFSQVGDKAPSLKSTFTVKTMTADFAS